MTKMKRNERDERSERDQVDAKDEFHSMRQKQRQQMTSCTRRGTCNCCNQKGTWSNAEDSDELCINENGEPSGCLRLSPPLTKWILKGQGSKSRLHRHHKLHRRFSHLSQNALPEGFPRSIQLWQRLQGILPSLSDSFLGCWPRLLWSNWSILPRGHTLQTLDIPICVL